MIPAKKNGWFLRWFSGVARSRIRRTFQFVHIRGVERLRALVAQPVLLVSNHTAFWDPLVAIWLTNFVAKTDSYALMDAKNLRRLPFFRITGAFGVDLDAPRDGGIGIRYAARLLRQPKTLVWIFAQGDERVVTERPLNFRAGAAAVARLAPDARVLPLALRYEFGNTERPELHINVGEPLAREADVETARATQEAAVTALLDELDRLLIDKVQPPAHELFLRHRPSALARWAEWWLAQLTRAGTPR
ncbi:MAG: lysophospholipid acyltransferase family protein [Myxococcota bacterium]